MNFPKIYCTIRQVTNFQNWQHESCDLLIYGEQSWQNEPKFHLNAHNFSKSFSDKIEINSLDKAFVKAFERDLQFGWFLRGQNFPTDLANDSIAEKCFDILGVF